jgi:hypothetical protein
MKKLNQLISFITIFLLTCGVGFTQTITKPKAQSRTPQQAVTPAATGNPVTGSGTVGRLSKWTGVDGSNSFTLGNSNIFEDKFGKVGIGTTTPTSPLTVQGMIETTLGGYKFPDGTIQTTAGLTLLFLDSTLKGGGTSSSPLGLRVPLTLIGATGNGGVLTIQSTTPSGSGIFVLGGVAGKIVAGGTGVTTIGGDSDNDKFGGIGLDSSGGSAFGEGDGGIGGLLFGGSARAGNGGDSIFAAGGGGTGTGKKGGNGITAMAGVASGGATEGLAGQFQGDVQIIGDLNVTGTKNFRIDHPLDPENKYLVHAAIESSEVLNIYSGNITTDANGEASVSLPDWFEAVNKDYRYQLTIVGTFAQAIVADEIKNNRFTIKTSAPNVKVSWQVTGVRSDAGLMKRPFKVEENKPEQERGTYLDPAAYNQPEERGTEWALHSEMMQRVKQTREKQIEESKQKSKNRNN